jgi:hypothetical protein
MLQAILRAGAVLALAVGASAASAQTAGSPPAAVSTLTTGTLAEICASEVDTARGYCRGFLVGVGQYHGEVTRPGGRAPIFCLPDPAPTLEAAQAGFVAWAAANPQSAGEKAVDGLLRWAAATYPCPTPARPRR